MNLQETAFGMFPGCNEIGSVGEDGIYEVGGIASTVVPKNCEVLASGVFQYSTKDRPCRTYLVKDKELFLMVRILSDVFNHLHVQIMERRPRDEHTAIRFAPKLQ